jgi:hypothetical protein
MVFLGLFIISTMFCHTAYMVHFLLFVQRNFSDVALLNTKHIHARLIRCALLILELATRVDIVGMSSACLLVCRVKVSKLSFIALHVSSVHRWTIVQLSNHSAN